MIRIAIVGLGIMGRKHLESYEQVDGAAVAVLCDERIDTQSGLPAETVTFDDFFRMLDAGGFDAVDICLPTYLHEKFAIEALKQGYYVLCEKPMALNKESLDAMIEAEKVNGAVLSVAHCLRYWPAYAEVKRLVDTGELGPVRYASFERYSEVPAWAAGGWLTDPVKSGGAALDLHIHDTDFILYSFGLPRSVVSQGLTDDKGGVSQISTHYRYDDKVVTASGGWSVSKSYGFTMKALVSFENATAVIDFNYPADNGSKGPSGLAIYPEEGTPYFPDVGTEDGYVRELRDFTASVRQGRPSAIISSEQAALSVRVCLEEIRSVREGREIELRAGQDHRHNGGGPAKS